MSYPKNASVSENVLRQAVDYHQSAGELSDSERLEVPALVRKIAGPTPPHRGEGAPVLAIFFSWGLIILAFLILLASTWGLL